MTPSAASAATSATISANGRLISAPRTAGTMQNAHELSQPIWIVTQALYDVSRRAGSALREQRLVVEHRLVEDLGDRPGGAGLVDQLGGAMDVVRAEHDVDPRRPLAHDVAVLLRQAAGDDDLPTVALGLPALQPAEVAVQPVVGVLPDAAGVDHDHVGVGLIDGRRPGRRRRAARRCARSRARSSGTRRCARRSCGLTSAQATAPGRPAQSTLIGRSSPAVKSSLTSTDVADAGGHPQLLGDLDHDLRVVGEEALGVLPALAELLALVGEPRPGLLDDAHVDGEVEHRTLAADALAVHDVELGLAERRGDLVLDDLHPGARPDDLATVLDALDPADVEAHRRVELQRPAARGGLRRTEHHADLLAQLVDEDHDRVGAVEVGGELAQRLAHQPGLQADVGVAHVALDLGPGGERRHRVDDHHVERTRAHEHVGDLQRLLTGVGLADQQLVDVDPDGPGVHRVHGVLGVDVGADAAVALGLGDDVHRQRRLARRLRAVDLDDAATGQAADAEGQVEGQRAGGDGLDGHRALLAHPHDGPLAELLVDGRQGHVECLVAICAHCALRSCLSGECREPRGSEPVGADGSEMSGACGSGVCAGHHTEGV